VSLGDPLQIVELKGLVAGPVNVGLALWSGATLPGLSIVLIAALVGFLGYGVSLALYVIALRHLGTARTGAYFSTAPFMGAVAAVALFGNPVSASLLVAGALIGLGVWLHLTETHDHEHAHDAMEHSHAHAHDAHHRHAHTRDVPPGEPHVHWHRHDQMVHSHPHVPDMHHAHRH
jgi:hypothetical protein